MATSKKINFVKVEACGNDGIIIDATRSKFPNANRLAKKLADRHLAIGADHVLFLGKSKSADYKVDIYNADGSVAEMCGNGVRSLARYIRDAKLTKKKELDIETKSGVHRVKVKAKTIDVDMGEPKLRGKEIPVNLSGRIINRPIKLETKDFRITCLSMGNPHCIIFHENLETLDLQKYGPQLETHNVFPKKCNISFVNVKEAKLIEMRVWERGVGETQACGTAACAALVASVLNNFTDRSATVAMPGGKVTVNWDKKSNHVWLAGPARIIFEGTYKL